jgi:hypothetical protein
MRCAQTGKVQVQHKGLNLSGARAAIMMVSEQN